MIHKLKSLYRFLSSRFQSVHLEYKVDVKPRSGHGLPPHSLLNEIIESNREEYKKYLTHFLEHKEKLQGIKKSSDEADENLPSWNNEYLPGLDIVSIYGMIGLHKPKRYIEIGSGNSTKVARMAITDNGLETEIMSIDPFPRASIDQLSDQVIRQPLENITDLSFITSSLSENDILFIDNSHRVFPNSDAMVCFLELLPYLKKGVIVHIHDIYLPFDYPQFMCDRFYNEQYVLAAFILANPQKYRTIFPNYFISEDRELSGMLSTFWNHPNLEGVERHGGSYWLQIN